MLPVRVGTLIMLLVALLFGSLAVFLAKTWLASQQVPVTQVAPPPEKIQTETIVIAKKDLNFGEPLTPDVLSEIDWPKGSKPDGSFATIADINKDGNRVVLTPISPNEPILAWKISGPGARASLSALVGKGLRAVTIRINDTSGIGGFVLPGDRVDVLYTRNKSETASIDVLLQNVRVLAINQNNDQKGANPIDGRTATLELSPVDAQKLSLAESTGALSFTLRAAGSLDAAPARRMLESELVSDASVYQPTDANAAAQAALAQRISDLEAKLKQDEANRAKPVVVETKTPAVPEKTEQEMPTTAQITIFRGLQSSDYTVPLDANQ